MKVDKKWKETLLNNSKKIELRKLDSQAISIIEWFKYKINKPFELNLSAGYQNNGQWNEECKLKAEVKNFEIIKVVKTEIDKNLNEDIIDVLWFHFVRSQSNLKDHGLFKNWIPLVEGHNSLKIIDPNFINWLNDYYKNEDYIVIYYLGKVSEIKH